MNNAGISHSTLTRREALRAGAIGFLGLGMAELSALRGLSQGETPRARSVIFVFLTGGLSHLDSFDLKPQAPDSIRGEFQSIATHTPGIRICEHLPLLAQRSEKWALVRSMATGSDGHEIACHMLLTGRLDLPAGFSVQNVPNPNEWPSMPAQVNYAKNGRGHHRLPPAVVLPEPSINEVGRVRPGQYAGRLGARWDAWHLHMATRCALGNGACPHCFRFEGTPFRHEPETIFETPPLTLPDGGLERLRGRIGLLDNLDQQRRTLEQNAESQQLDRHRQQAVSVLNDARTRRAFEVERADARTVDRYGRNKFGLSLLMAYRLVEAGVNLVQVNLGKNSSWDTHRRNFVNLKDNLFPYFDRSVAALLDDLADSGLLRDTLVIVTGEFGRTPRINQDAGRDHWGPVMSLLLAGGGVAGGRVIGASDRIGGQPVADRQTPENLAATLYSALGIPGDATWHDTDGRPYELYRAHPIPGLT
ncbi:MAG: DUF1501 domain-containing protein [Planctomycetes bacterium]|nr:DUF1501 domain-containing protein [Planctomycetota bacterium]